MNKTTKTAMIVLSLLVVWMLSGFFFSDPKNNTEISIAIDSEENIINVKAKQFSSELRLSSVAIQGRTEANRSVLISSETNGIVENILSDKGDQVKKGQIICKLSVDSRKAKLDEAEALMRQKELEWEASKVLVEKGYRSQTKAAGSKAAFDASKALVIQMQKELENINIRAPFNGFFNDNLSEIGDFLAIGMPCGQIIDYNPILVTGQISEQEIKKVKTGVMAQTILSTGEKLEGLVSYISKTADKKTRTFRVEVKIENADFKIKDGITAELFLPTQKVLAHLIPPSSLTLDQDGKIGIRHIDNNKVIFSGVEIVGDKGELVWVTGLPNKVTIITVGQEFVMENQTVNYTLEES
ncbi:efflux RND transporter periplasmic adaptor subunit [Rhodobiaceae bacterium]|nr:efflux RND transporter periplasmic adaptor subunit [Rhodobiaceae bacterium]